MLKEKAIFFKRGIFLLDLMGIIFSWLFAYYIFFVIQFPINTKNILGLEFYIFLTIPIFIIWGSAFQLLDLYRPRRLIDRLSEIIDVTKANILSMFAFTIILFFLGQFTLQYSYKPQPYFKFLLIYFFILSLIVQVFSRLLIRSALKYARHLGYNQRYAVIIGTGEEAQTVSKLLKKNHDLGIQINGCLARDPEEIGKSYNAVRVIGLYTDIEEIIESGPDIVFVCIPLDTKIHKKKLSSYLVNTCIDIQIVPSLGGITLFCPSFEIFEGLPLFTIRGAPISQWGLVGKRFMDLFCTICGFVLLPWLFLLIGLVIRLTSGSPIFYSQTRVGVDGQTFKILKFRTMKVGAESETGAIFAEQIDSRCTPIGKLLRKTSLDELPQLWNVFKGEMSIVGPRPERPEFVAQFNQKITDYALRGKMKSGITGWAQVNDLRGNSSLEKRLEYDIFYMNHWSFLFDIKIILMTIIKGFFHRNAY